LRDFLKAREFKQVNFMIKREHQETSNLIAFFGQNGEFAVHTIDEVRHTSRHIKTSNKYLEILNEPRQLQIVFRQLDEDYWINDKTRSFLIITKNEACKDIMQILYEYQELFLERNMKLYLPTL
jgi:hypothetical protein